MTNFYLKKQYLLNDRKSAVADGPRDALCGLKPCKMSNSELATDIFGQRSTLSCPAPQWSFRDFGATIQTSQVTTYLLIRLNKIIRITEGKSIDRAISVKKRGITKGEICQFPGFTQADDDGNIWLLWCQKCSNFCATWSPGSHSFRCCLLLLLIINTPWYCRRR